MENIHILTTSKPSRLLNCIEGFRLFEEEVSPDNEWCVNVNIHITSDEEIKEGDPRINNYQRKPKGEEIPSKKIILTTDQDLIKDGVQAIDDEFLEWFVKNPSCEGVEVIPYLKDIINPLTNEKYPVVQHRHFDESKMIFGYHYKLIIPKEEPKTAWVGVFHDKLNEYHPAEYELKDIYQGEGCLPNFPNEELCQTWCDSKYKEEHTYTNKEIRTWWLNQTEERRRNMVREYFKGGNSENINTLYGIMPEEMEEMYNINVDVIIMDWEEILFDFIDFYPCQLPDELFEWLEENYEIPKKKDAKHI